MGMSLFFSPASRLRERARSKPLPLKGGIGVNDSAGLRPNREGVTHPPPPFLRREGERV
jgi:hypothetical protein